MLHAQFMPIFFEGADNDFMQSDLTEVIVKFSGDIQFIRQDLDAQVEILLKGYAIITFALPICYACGIYQEKSRYGKPIQKPCAEYGVYTRTTHS